MTILFMVLTALTLSAFWKEAVAVVLTGSGILLILGVVKLAEVLRLGGLS